MSKQIKIFTFGKFQLSDGVQIFTETTSNKSKVWSTLKYMIAFYGKPVSADRLSGILWSDEEIDDPAKLLRDIIYQLRKKLTAFYGEQPFIIFSQGNYYWNPDIDVWIDFLEFDELLNQARDDSKPYNERIEMYNAAINLYDGPFLRDSAIEIWTLLFTDFYRRLYLQAINELADLYEEEIMLDEIVTLYNKAIAIEPYEESLYIRQMQTLIDNGEYEYARRQYRLFEKLLMREFGTKPSQRLERLLYEIDRATSGLTGNLEDITKFFEEGDKKRGALLCGPETFRKIYMLDKRSVERIQFPVFLALLTFVRYSDPEKRCDGEFEELKDAMKTLRQVLVSSLRKGDVISQYSRCQFILMLTVPNIEGGYVALRRIKYLFESKYGKTRGSLEYNLSLLGREDVRLDSASDDQPLLSE